LLSVWSWLVVVMEGVLRLLRMAGLLLLLLTVAVLSMLVLAAGGFCRAVAACRFSKAAV
jgi:hypothetical protein